MPESVLAKKLKLKSGYKAVVLNAPGDYLPTLHPLPAGVELGDKLAGPYDWVQIFVKNKAELDRLLPRVLAALQPISLLWISFPKGSSKIQTDLTRDQGWDAVPASKLKWITLVSVNETWSAFALRPYQPGEARQSLDNRFRQ